MPLLHYQSSTLHRGGGSDEAAPADASSRADPRFLVCALIIVCNTVLQKLAVPGTGGSIPLATLALIGAAAYLWLTGAAVLAARGAIALAILISTTAICILVNGFWYVSLSSWFLLCAIHSPYAVRLRADDRLHKAVVGFYIRLMTAVATVAVIQFLAQFFVGPRLAFFLDYSIPDVIFLQGYNNVVPLTYGSLTYKSNGFFLAEPSFLSLFLAIALIAELYAESRTFVVCVIGAALVCSYSGSGLLILAIFLPVLAIRQRLFKLVGLGLLGLCITSLFYDALNLSLFQDRITEISRPRSSGYARFVSIFFLLDQFVFSSLETTVFGRGPGSVTEYLKWLPFEAHDPTWGKMVYEYGLLGGLAYALFLFLVFSLAPGNRLRWPLLIAHVFLGGYLLNPFIHSLIVVFVVWSSPRFQSQSRMTPARRLAWAGRQRYSRGISAGGGAAATDHEV